MRGSDLTPAIIRMAYESGVFPMGDDDSDEVLFYEPIERAIFPISGVTLSRSMKKFLRTMPFRISFDRDFPAVMRACRRPDENWITEDIIRVYCEIHEAGWAHSCEVWDGCELVGGTYGLAMGGCFCAESMFHRRTNASKVALWAMVEQCRHLGFTIFDAQVMNPHLRSMGAYGISQQKYLREFEAARKSLTAWSR